MPTSLLVAGEISRCRSSFQCRLRRSRPTPTVMGNFERLLCILPANEHFHRESSIKLRKVLVNVSSSNGLITTFHVSPASAPFLSINSHVHARSNQEHGYRNQRLSEEAARGAECLDCNHPDFRSDCGRRYRIPQIPRSRNCQGSGAAEH